MSFKGLEFFRLSTAVRTESRKRFHLFRLFVLLLIVLTLGLLSSVRADTSVANSFTGFYKPARFIVGEEIQLPDSISVEEIRIKDEPSTHSVLNSITRSSKNAEVGKTFLENLSNLGGQPRTETISGLLGCTVISRSSRLEGSKLILTTEKTFRLGCGLTISKKVNTLTLSKGEYDGEILFASLDQRGRVQARYYFKRN